MSAATVHECEEGACGPMQGIPQAADRTARHGIEVGLLTGGSDRHYAIGLAMALIAKGVRLEVIGSDRDDGPEMHATPNLVFLNLHGSVEGSVLGKVRKLTVFYARLLLYAAATKAKIFHILWNNKFEFVDRTVLMLYYRLLGKKIVFTAHNVNAGKRDMKDSLINRLTLKTQYRLSDHIFVHTAQMKTQLIEEFGVRERAVSIIPFGINNAVPNTGLTSTEAKQRLGIQYGEKAILFFGAIKSYKGLDYLLAAFREVIARQSNYRLIIAGERKKGHEKYFSKIEQAISLDSIGHQIIQNIQYIPDAETELYFKAADVLALPYTEIFQSGVLFLSYSFGLPVIASDVGSFKNDVIEGKTGFICNPCDPSDLANAIERYFDSDLFKDLDNRRRDIRQYAEARNSWETVGDITNKTYKELAGIQD